MIRQDTDHPTDSFAEEEVSHASLIHQFRTLSSSDFRSQIETLVANPPPALRDVNKDFKVAHGFERDKFIHTTETLKLLDAEGLTTDEQFIARMAMMLHDCEPTKVVEDLCEWVRSGEISNEEAVSIMQQVWWHDLLGVDVNQNLEFTAEIGRVISNVRSREINLKVFAADVGAYGFKDRYQEVFPQVKNLESDEKVIDHHQISAENYSQLHLSAPDDDDIFVHGIYTRVGSERTHRITPPILLNMLANNELKSASLVTALENRKTVKSPRHGKATDFELNMFRYKPGQFPAEIGMFGQQPDNWLTLVFFGKDIKEDVAVKPLTTAESTPYVAGLVNRFSETEKIRGCALPLDHAHFIIKVDGVGSLVPLLKIQALRLNQDPNVYCNKRVVVQGPTDTVEELAHLLQKDELEIRAHNAKRIIEGLQYSGYVSDDLLLDNFEALMQNGEERKHFDLNKYPDNLPCRIIRNEDWSNNQTSEQLADRLKAFPWLANEPACTELAAKLRSDHDERAFLLKQVDQHKGYFLDEKTKILYIRGQFNCVVMIDAVASFTVQVENEGQVFTELATIAIKLQDGSELTIKKSKMDYL